jgi:hypothetical protein
MNRHRVRFLPSGQRSLSIFSESTLRQAQKGERKNPYLMDSETCRAEALEARLRIYRQSLSRE